MASAEAHLEAFAGDAVKAGKWSNIDRMDSGRFVPLNASVVGRLAEARMFAVEE